MTEQHSFPTESFVAALDIQTLEWTEDKVRRYIDLKPFHFNASGVVHGGVILSLLDSTSGRAGQYMPPGEPRRYSVTVSISCNFVGQTRSGRLIAEGRKISAGRSLYFTQVEVRNDSGELVATANGVHRYRKERKTSHANNQS